MSPKSTILHMGLKNATTTCANPYDGHLKNRSGGGSRELYVHCGGLGGVLGFPPLGGPAHRPYTRPQCPGVFLSPRPPLNYKITFFRPRSRREAGTDLRLICAHLSVPPRAAPAADRPPVVCRFSPRLYPFVQIICTSQNRLHSLPDTRAWWSLQTAFVQWAETPRPEDIWCASVELIAQTFEMTFL